MRSEHLTLIHERVELCRMGENPTVIGRTPSGWAVMGDHQFMKGYSLLLPEPVVPDLNDLDIAARERFLLDMALLGEAVSACTPAYRINYEILGNSEPALHAHVWPRFRNEPDDFRRGPVWRYPEELRNTEPFSEEAHGELRRRLGGVLGRLLGETSPPEGATP